MKCFIYLSLLFSASALCSTASLQRLLVRTVRVGEIGTGSIVSAPSGKHYVLTNSHVCLYLHNNLLIGHTATGVGISAKVTKDDPDSDLCAAEVSLKYPALTVSQGTWYKGQQVCTGGYPNGKLRSLCGTLSYLSTWEYEFSAYLFHYVCPPHFKRRYSKVDGGLLACTRTTTSIGSNLACRPGASGSPVIDAQGQLIGVISDYDGTTPDFAGQVPLNLIQDFMSDL